MKDERFQELCAGAVLGDLDERERAELAAMADEARIAAEIAAFERASAAVIASLQQGRLEAMPASLSARLARDASAFVTARRAPPEQPRASQVAPPSRPSVRPESRSRGSMLPWFVAAAATVLASVLWFSKSSQPGVLPVTDVARFAADHPDLERRPFELGCKGEVLWSPGDNAGLLELRDLPANDPREFQYQLWIFDESQDKSTPVDGGVFDVPKGGANPIVIPIDAKLRVGKAFAFAITKEPPGGVVVSAKRPEQIVAAVGL